MKKHLANLLCGFLSACILASSAFAATIQPSVSSVTLAQGENTVTFDIKLHVDEAFAGAEFGLKPSSTSVALEELTMLSDVSDGSPVRTVKNGVLYFGFFTGSNKFPAGDYTVAQVTYQYSGSSNQSISLVSSKVVTVGEGGTTQGDTETPGFTVQISRAGTSTGGGGGGGGGGATLPTTPNKPAQADGTFLDVPEKTFFYDAVEWAVKQGITTGVSEDYFDPDGTCTRAQAVTFLWRAAGKPAPQSKEMPFTDISDAAYYRDAVLWAVEQGITRGTSDTTFSPDQQCSRGHIVTFLHRAQNTPAVEGSHSFTDVRDGSFYADAVVWAVNNGITTGVTATSFAPDAPCTRGQIVTFLYRGLAK